MSRGGDYWRRARKAANDPTWRQDAACRGMGPDLFFGDRSEAALKVCGRCPVRKQCSMTAAVQQEHNGVWGGKRRDVVSRGPREDQLSNDDIADAVLTLVGRVSEFVSSYPHETVRPPVSSTGKDGA